MNGKIRISILDGFRAISIISVMLYHYFSRWTPPKNNVSLYPYGDKYNFFNYGYLGVQFFFVISGFVIFFTLERTDNLIAFWQKRMIRLFPSILIATLITYFFFILFDKYNLFPNSHFLKNFIPGLTFVYPYILNNIFNIDTSYINGSYWSLWPEIQFYILASLLYYFNKKRFLINFITASIILISINLIFENIKGSNRLHIELSNESLNFYTKWISNSFNLITFLPFFCLGVIFYKISSNKKEKKKLSTFLKISLLLIVLFIMYSGEVFQVRIIYFFIIGIFLLFIYLPSNLSFLENKIVTEIGESSYFLYLIHENIGVFLIYTLGKFILPGSFLMPVLLIILFSYFSILFSKKVDQPINKWLKNKINKLPSIKK